ncbi:MAG: response regulator [Bacteroidota bacterium]
MTIPIKILVVDDEADMQELVKWQFRRGIKKKQYEFQYALSGLQALEILKADSEIDIILLDINMPEMDGLTMLGKVKETALMLKTIMVTAYGNMNNIRAAMNGGAFDFVTKPINITDLKTTIAKAFDELIQLKEGADAQRQLPITQQALEETDQKARFLEELDEVKSRFFTNISHEFRTPLTVIQGMSDQILSNPDKWIRKGPKMIRRNTDQLLDLVNQILDLRKLEAGQLSLHLEQIEAGAFIRHLTESFQPLAENKDISLTSVPSVEEIWMDLDTEKLIRIMSNLLSNAIKFTPSGEQISVKIMKDKGKDLSTAFVEVSDTGIGIPAARLPQIFDRFYQVDSSSTRKQEGTGIGLALCKELVHLMGGEILVESEEGQGTRFQIGIPISQTAQKVIKEVKPVLPLLQIPDQDQEEDVQEASLSGEKPSLLIVEDNPDVVEYLAACLEDQYQLLIARDGQEGIDTALEQVPDLIISDVMMPEKDGFELCDILKQDIRTSHIPIVLLTAKADHASRIQGLKKGADAYLAKPFNQEELFVRLEKLLEIRRAIQARYGGRASPEPSAEYQLEDDFLRKVHEVIESNMSQSYDMPTLCKKLGMGRTNVHRKFKALTGTSSSRYIRRFRLQKARQLLTESDLQVSEIAYEVGFSDPSYFTKSFRLEFGVPPKEFRDV